MGRISRDALEIGKLMVELLNAGSVRRPARTERSVAEDTSRLSAHAIRAAMHIYQHPEPTIGDLARALAISFGWASRLADELETAGYVERIRSVDDRRVVRLRLHDGVRVEIESVYRERADAVDAALESFDAEQRKVIRSFLARLREELQTAG